MANVALAPTKLLQEAGFLYWAPLSTAVPVNTVVGSVYTDVWTAPWVPLGPTESGMDFTYTSTVQPVMIAELYDPITYRTTDRSGSFGYMLASITAANMIKTFNGATNVVTGTGTTQTTRIAPVQVGNEVRCMIGWESFDQSTRIIAYQVMNSGAMKLSANKSPAKMTLPWMGNFEVPGGGTGLPWTIDTTR